MSGEPPYPFPVAAVRALLELKVVGRSTCAPGDPVHRGRSGRRGQLALGRGERGISSTFSAMMLRWISEVPA